MTRLPVARNDTRREVRSATVRRPTPALWGARKAREMPSGGVGRAGEPGRPLDLARRAGRCLVELGGIEPPSESLCQADLHA